MRVVYPNVDFIPVPLRMEHALFVLQRQKKNVSIKLPIATESVKRTIIVPTSNQRLQTHHALYADQAHVERVFQRSQLKIHVPLHVLLILQSKRPFNMVRLKQVVVVV